MSKPLSRLRRATRELQLGLSLGVVCVFLHALFTSTLFLYWTPPTFTSHLSFEVARALAGRGDLLILAPLLSAGAAYAFSVNPWSSSIGTVGLVEATMLFMHWSRGGFDEDERPFAYLVPFWGVSLLAALLAVAAGRWAAARAAAQRAATPAPTASAPAAANDFAEQMRAAQERARGVVPSTSTPAAPDSAPPPSDKPPPSEPSS